MLANMSAKLQILHQYLLIAFLSLNCVTLSVNFDYAKCNEGEDDCRHCYTALVRAVFGNDKNVFNLNEAFFPPRTNPAEFVVITYRFKNESMDEPAIWFWTEQSSYLLHPLHTFQFLSLFFGKPEAFYTQQADVTLDATGCWGVDDDHLELITQRLKTYVQKQDILASIDNTYSAKAVNHDLLEKILTTRRNEITNIIVSLQCVMIILVAIVVITVMIFQSCSHKWPKRLQKLSTVNKYLKKKQAAIIGVAIIGFLFILYIIALDFAALGKRDNPLKPVISNDSIGIHFKADKTSKYNPFTLLYEIPGIVLFFDLIGLLISSVMILLSLISMCFSASDYNCNCGNTFLYLCLSTLGFIYSLITHLPFIAIAYLNDAYHAGSIFIYYTIIILISFALIEQLIVSCQKRIFDVHNISDSDIKFEGTWALKKGLLHILSPDDQQQPRKKHKLKLQNGTLEVSSSQVQVDFEKIESEIILEIDSGTLQFTVSKSDNTLSLCAQEQAITLDVKKLPILVQQKDSPDLKLKGLTPKSGQKFNIERDIVNPDDNNKNIKMVKVAKTMLHLQKAGKVQYSSLCTWGCGALPTKALWCLITSGVVSFVILLTLAVVVILTCYFVIIPINRSISDAPNRLVGIYESAIVLIGAYIAYKAFFKAKKYLERSVVNRENPLLSQESKDIWKDMSEEEN